MRILLDECVHAGVRVAFPGHDVKTVAEIGLRSSKDGPLLAAAEQQFDVFVTIDRSLQHQQNLAKFNIGFVIARVPRNEIAFYEPLFEQLQQAVEAIRPGEILLVTSPESRR